MEEKHNSQNHLEEFSKLLHNSDLGNRTHLSQYMSNRSESARNGLAGQQSTHIACTMNITEEKNNSQNTNLLKFSKSLHPENRPYLSQKPYNGYKSARNGFPDKNSTQTTCHTNFLRKKFSRLKSLNYYYYYYYT